MLRLDKDGTGSTCYGRPFLKSNQERKHVSLRVATFLAVLCLATVGAFASAPVTDDAYVLQTNGTKKLWIVSVSSTTVARGIHPPAIRRDPASGGCDFRSDHTRDR